MSERNRPQPSYFIIKIDDETVDAIEDVCQEIAIDNVMASEYVWELLVTHYLFNRLPSGPSAEA